MTQEVWLNTMADLKKFAIEQDASAVDFCDNILNTYQLTNEELLKFNKIKSNLEDFEFDAALEILNNEC
jgi:hypothetical protein